MKTVGVVPARFASQRFPGKMLADLGGKPLVVQTALQAAKAEALAEVWVATDDDRIEDAVRAEGLQVIRTRADHPSGTDRIAEAIEFLDADVVVNVQGDEPFVEPQVLNALAERMASSDAPDMATACTPIREAAALSDPSVVKVVCGESGQALYFSRSLIPYARDVDPETLLNSGIYFRHLGLYAYRRSFLEQWRDLPPHPLETTEKLEQLRALAHGATIAVLTMDHPAPGVDTPEDLDKARVLFSTQESSA